MGKCAWCHREFGDADSHRQQNPLCAALWDAQTDDAPADVARVVRVLYWWVQERVGHNPRAAELRRRFTESLRV